MGCEPIAEEHIKNFSQQGRRRGAQSQNNGYELVPMEPHPHTGPQPE